MQTQYRHREIFVTQILWYASAVAQQGYSKHHLQVVLLCFMVQYDTIYSRSKILNLQETNFILLIIANGKLNYSFFSIVSFLIDPLFNLRRNSFRIYTCLHFNSFTDYKEAFYLNFYFLCLVLFLVCMLCVVLLILCWNAVQVQSDGILFQIIPFSNLHLYASNLYFVLQTNKQTNTK